MKKIFIVLMLAGILTGCKPTEANYKAAYDIAKQKKEQSNDDVPQGSSLQKYDMHKQTVISGDKFMILRTYVTPVDEGVITRESLKRYNVVVGQFKQIFNAKQMRKRLNENGYPDAGILKIRNQDYLVISNQSSTTEDLKKDLNKVESDSLLTLRDPLPFVLVPATFTLK